MEVFKMNKGLNITLSVLTKIAEIALWIGAVAGIVACVGCAFDTNGMNELLLENKELVNPTMTLNAVSDTGEINFFAVITFFIGTSITLVLTALIFRNIYNILATIAGRNKHTESTSPFQKDVIRMIKEIGIFSIATPVIGFVVSTIITAVSIINGTAAETSVSLNSVIIGLMCFCLTQIFTYGAKLEEEVDGLV